LSPCIFRNANPRTSLPPLLPASLLQARRRLFLLRRLTEDAPSGGVSLGVDATFKALPDAPPAATQSLGAEVVSNMRDCCPYKDGCPKESVCNSDSLAKVTSATGTVASGEEKSELGVSGRDQPLLGNGSPGRP
jgi:hypothetical protein